MCNATPATRPDAPASRTPARDRSLFIAALTYPFDTVEYLALRGRLDEREWRFFQTLWCWSAARFSGAANARQYAYSQRCGSDATHRRIDRTRRFVETLIKQARQSSDTTHLPH